jgi:hypothetical protein
MSLALDRNVRAVLRRPLHARDAEQMPGWRRTAPGPTTSVCERERRPPANQADGAARTPTMGAIGTRDIRRLIRNVKHMTSSVETGLKRWKVLFIVLEAIVLIPFLFMLFSPNSNHRGSQFSLWQVVLAVVYLGSWLFLLIGSPFFLRSLRGIAVSGWIVAFGTLLYAVLNPRL